MLDLKVDALFQIAGFGLAVSFIENYLYSHGKKEQATFVSTAGFAILAAVVIKLLADSFTSIRTFFHI